MGRMLMEQLAPGVNASRSNGSILGLEQSAQVPTNGGVKSHGVKAVSRSEELSRLLDAAKDSCAIIFFTSATCPPCKVLYPLYDQLAEEFGHQITFIKIDISQPQTMDISQNFSVRATPTFVTMLKGKEENRWSGADQAALRGNVHLLSQMAHPSHLHERLRLPSFSNPNVKPVLYSKVPPMAKLDVKMGEQVANKPQIKKLKSFLDARSNLGPQDAVLPDLGELSECIRESVLQMTPETLFAVIDLFRCALSDPRVSAYSAEEPEQQTIKAILDFANGLDSCPYALRLVTVQMACNMFSTPLFAHEVLRNASLRTALVQLVSTSFLDDAHNNVRVASSSLLFNIALANRKTREGDAAGLPEEDQVELAAALVEAISQEEKSVEALQGMLSALGHLVYGTRLDGELADLLRALDAQSTISAKKKHFPNEKLLPEVADELLGKGLRRP